MDCEFRSLEAQIPMYPQHSSSPQPNHPMYAPPPPPSSSSSSSALYPKLGPNHGRPFPQHPHNPPPPSSASSGLGIRVTIKPEYRITPPPQLSPYVGEIPRSNFQFDFELERKILAEAEKENQNWVKLGLENLPSRTPASTSSSSSVGSIPDPTVAKYIASGLSREAVTIAVGHYGDNSTKVPEFVNGYNLLREMGFPSKSVADALIMYENDTDKALAHFLNGSS
ncbi:branchpoint-bridging protein [Cannabis sativa]|uniref:branchpoint-bridging protein n=1 Tax=Cannabis sativa TaxID=3483 RepID=UPI0029CA9997|nr:branchpoint-bridging protein [Cannabis sativa]